jgi:hypothetical protein
LQQQKTLGVANNKHRHRFSTPKRSHLEASHKNHVPSWISCKLNSPLYQKKEEAQFTSAAYSASFTSVGYANRHHASERGLRVPRTAPSRVVVGSRENGRGNPAAPARASTTHAATRIGHY